MPVTLLDEPWGTLPAPDEQGGACDSLDPCGYPSVVTNEYLKLHLGGFRGGLPLRSSLNGEAGSLKRYVYDLPLVHGTSASLSMESDRGRVELDRLPFLESPKSPFSSSLESDDAEEDDVEGLLAFINSAVGLFDEIRVSAEYVTGRRVPESDIQEFLALDSDSYRKGVFEYLPLDWSDASKIILKESNEPRFDLILRIALEFGEELRQLAKNPRKVLRRERRKTALSRVQQLDSACLAWLVRQPGRTAIEKAGSTQKIYSIVREEFFDTLENRVLKKFIHMCEMQASNYLKRNHRYKESDRYNLVKRFMFHCHHASQEPLLATITDLKELPQPNYVLQFDTKYGKLWKYYLQLVHREKEVEHAWTWQRRLWSEVVRLFISSAILKLTSSEEFTSCQHGLSHLSIHHRTIFGQRIESGWWPSKIEVGLDACRRVIIDSFDAVNLHLTALPESVKDLASQSGADFYVYFTPLNPDDNSTDILLCIWSLHSPKKFEGCGDYKPQLFRAADALNKLHVNSQYDGQLKGLIVRSDVWGDSRDLGQRSSGGVTVEGICLSGNPDDWRGDLADESVQFLAECALGCFEGGEK